MAPGKGCQLVNNAFLRVHQGSIMFLVCTMPQQRFVDSSCERHSRHEPKPITVKTRDMEYMHPT